MALTQKQQCDNKLQTFSWCKIFECLCTMHAADIGLYFEAQSINSEIYFAKESKRKHQKVIFMFNNLCDLNLLLLLSIIRQKCILFQYRRYNITCLGFVTDLDVWMFALDLFWCRKTFFGLTSAVYVLDH